MNTEGYDRLEIWCDEQINEIVKNRNNLHREVLLICFFDSFAQENCFSNETENGSKFREFIDEFYSNGDVKKSALLGAVDYVQMYYFLADSSTKLNEEGQKIRGTLEGLYSRLPTNSGEMLPIEKVSLQMEQSHPELLVHQGETKKLCNGKNQYFSLKSLIYFRRNKLVHNFRDLSGPGWDDIRQPYYEQQSRWDPETKTLFDLHDRWATVFPTKFLINLVQEAIKNYLNRCRTEKDFGKFVADLKMDQKSWLLR